MLLCGLKVDSGKAVFSVVISIMRLFGQVSKRAHRFAPCFGNLISFVCHVRQAGGQAGRQLGRPWLDLSWYIVSEKGREKKVDIIGVRSTFIKLMKLCHLIDRRVRRKPISFHIIVSEL